MPAPAPNTLGFGTFYGDPQMRCDVSGFSLSRIVAATRPLEVPDHTHDTAHVVFVLDGRYVSSSTRLEPGRDPRLVYNPPGTTHRDRFQTLSGNFFTLSISDRRLESLGRPSNAPAHAVAVASGPAVRRAKRLLRLCESNVRRPARQLEASSLDLLHALFEDVRLGRPRPPAWLLVVRDRLANRYDEALHLNGLAASVGVHPVHLIRAFRRFFGATPGDYVRDRRLAAAAALLATTDLPIVEIALRTGFADQSHLTRTFTPAFAMPPAAYRRAHQARGIPG